MKIQERRNHTRREAHPRVRSRACGRLSSNQYQCVVARRRWRGGVAAGGPYGGSGWSVLRAAGTPAHPHPQHPQIAANEGVAVVGGFRSIHNDGGRGLHTSSYTRSAHVRPCPRVLPKISPSACLNIRAELELRNTGTECCRKAVSNYRWRSGAIMTPRFRHGFEAAGSPRTFRADTPVPWVTKLSNQRSRLPKLEWEGSFTRN